ncbi:MAG: hypothetical protein WBP11_00305 [Dokdonella sp.]
MNNHIPANEELSALYRSSRATVGGFDAETLLAYLDGGLSLERRADIDQQLSDSDAARSLLAMLAELQPASATLADHVAEHRADRHAIAQRSQRRVAAPSARPRRVAAWFSAVAASALAVIAIFAFHGSQKATDHKLASDSAARGDQIFAMREDRIFSPDMGGTARSAAAGGSDRVFDSSFTKGG